MAVGRAASVVSGERAWTSAGRRYPRCPEGRPTACYAGGPGYAGTVCGIKHSFMSAHCVFGRFAGLRRNCRLYVAMLFIHDGEKEWDSGKHRLAG